MKKGTLRIPKLMLCLLMNGAFMLMVTNINLTCCGPGYQPELPSKLNELKRYRDDE